MVATKKESNRERLEKILLESDGRDFQSCGGYRILSYQIQSLLENNQKEHKRLEDEMRNLEQRSDENDNKIIEKLDKLIEKIDSNKKDGNDRAIGTESRLSSLETSMKGMSSYLKWISRSVILGVIMFIAENIGLIDWIENILQNIF